MAEAANPETGANQEPPSIDERMQNFLTQFDGEQTDADEPEQPSAPPAQAEQPEGQADELTPDDIPAEVAQPNAVDEFEIVHNGQQRKLSREETIRFAQQGFDYSQKMHAVGEAERQIQQRFEQVQQLEQMQNALAPDLAQVKAVESQLAQWQNVNWVQLATDSPLEYPKYRAQYDQLVNAYQMAAGRFQHKFQAVQAQKQAVVTQTLEQQRAKLLDLMPEWKDPAKYESGAKEVRDYLIRSGVSPENVERLSDALGVKIAADAAAYDRLKRAKSEKSKQLRTVPPMTRPGAAQTSTSADKDSALKQRLRKTGDVKDAAALLLNRMK